MLSKEKIMNLFKNKSKNEMINITIIDDNKELPDFRKIAVPDLKQYLIKGYEEIRQVKKEKEELEEELNNYKIQENELKKKQEEIEKLIIDRNAKAIDEYKEKLIKEINNCKGNISKSKLINIIEGVNRC